MFYAGKFSQNIRFGDVLGGFLLTSCVDYRPIQSGVPSSYKVEVINPEYVSVLTPCCTIANKSGEALIVSPLEKINPTFYFKNSYWREDLSRINQPMSWDEAIGPEMLKSMSDEDIQKRIKPSKDYSHTHIYIYMGHDLLPEYDIRYGQQGPEKVNCYMVDFRKLYKIEFKKEHDAESLKYLELAAISRDALRSKFANFFGRCPEEDM